MHHKNENAHGMISMEEYLSKRKKERRQELKTGTEQEKRAAELAAALELALLYV